MNPTSKQLLALSQATQVVTAYLDLDQVLERIVKLASKAVGSDYTTVVLIDEKGRTIKSAENISGIPPIEYRQRERGFTHWIIKHGQPLIADKIGKNGQVNLGKNRPSKVNPPLIKAKVKSIIGLPLKGKKHLLGVLYFHSLQLKNFSEQLVLLTAFANQAAIAVENARLYEDLEKTVAQRTKKLTQLVKSQKEFIAHVGHELRTPLSIIKAVVEADLDVPGQKKRHLDLINRKVDLISRILRNLMWVSRLQIGQKSLYKTKFCLENLLKEVVEDTFEEAKSNQIQTRFKIYCPQEIRLYHDRTKIMEVLINLVKNAVVHSEGKANITLKVIKTKNRLQIIVDDKNPSIPKNELKKIFTPFYRSKRNRGKSMGAGLGLYISQKLIELMGGKIWAEIKKTRGNRFVLQLPI